MRIERPGEVHGLPRAGVEGPDHSVGQPGRMAAGAILPAFGGKTIVGRDGSAGRTLEVPARGEEHLRSHTDLLGQRSRSRKTGRPHHLDHGVGGEVDDGDVAGHVVRRIGACAGGVDDNAERVLAGVEAGRRRIRRIVQIDVAGRIPIDSEAQQAVHINVELDEEITARRRDIGLADAALRREGDRPGVGEEQPDLARFRIACAEMQVEERQVGLCARADAGDDVQEGLRVDVELQRPRRRGCDIGKVAAVAAQHDALQLVRECECRIGNAVAAPIDDETGGARGERLGWRGAGSSSPQC